MMSKFKEIKALLDSLTCNPYILTIEKVFTLSEDEVYWKDGECDYHTAEILEGITRQDDCVFINASNGCGDTITYVFPKDLEVTEDQWVEMFND
jgi:hypothetical protein